MILLLLTLTSNQDSGYSTHQCGLTRAFAVCIHKVWKQIWFQTKHEDHSPTSELYKHA